MSFANKVLRLALLISVVALSLEINAQEETIEDVIQNALEDDGEHDAKAVLKMPSPRLYRGFSTAGFTELELLSYLLGDRRFEIRSWDYSRILEKKVSNGLRLSEALVETDKEVSRRVKAELETLGAFGFAAKNALGTAKGLPYDERSSLTLSFEIDSPGLAERFAMTSLRARIRDGETSPENLRAFIIEVSPPRPRGVLVDSEYQLASHVPASLVKGVYIGVPRDIDAGIKRNGDLKMRWLYLKVNSGRGSSQREPLRLEVYRVSYAKEKSDRVARIDNTLEIASSPHLILSPETLEKAFGSAVTGDPVLHSLVSAWRMARSHGGPPGLCSSLFGRQRASD